MKQGFIYILVLALTGCVKSDLTLNPTGSIQVLNGVNGGKVIKFRNYLRDSLPNNSSKVFALQAGLSELYFFPSGDSLHPYFNRQMDIRLGDRYSLFISGGAGAVDTLLVKEGAFPTYVDSQYGLRFVNLYYNSPLLKITLSSSPTSPIFSNMGYQSISGFNGLPGKIANGKDTLQVRNSATNAVLATYAFAENISVNKIPRFFNSTFVLKGIVGGSGANSIGLIRVNHY